MFQQDGKSGADANFKKHLRSKSAEELKAELNAIFEKEESTGVEADPELVAEYFSAMETKELDTQAPLPGNFEESWATFTKNHPDLFPNEKTKSRNRSAQMRRFFEAAILAAAILVLSATAFEWPDYVIHWGQGLFHISPSVSGTMELPEPNIDGYISLENAVTDICGEQVSVPTWIPERYTIKALTSQITSHFSSVIAVYVSSDSELTIRVTYYEDKDEIPDFSFEENRNAQAIYEKSNVDYFFVNNFDRLQAMWKSGNYLYSISGDVSKNEIEQIVNSVYGG